MSPIKEARFDRLIQEQTLAGFQIGLINKVKAAFYENVMQQRNVRFSQEILEISQGILNLITSRFKNRTISRDGCDDCQDRDE